MRRSDLFQARDVDQTGATPDNSAVEAIIRQVMDYPSSLGGMLGPPEPMLLDTCVIQNIEWVWDRMEEDEGGSWSDERVQALERRYGRTYANELLDLGSLVDVLQWQGFPWLVSASSRAEFERLQSDKRTQLVAGWTRLSDHQEEWSIDSFQGVAAAVLDPTPEVRINPLILKALGVTGSNEIVGDDGPLGVLNDMGDRMLVRDALLAGVPAILTMDLGSLWRHRAALYDLGVEVWRPSDALTAYGPKWAEEAASLARRRAEQDAAQIYCSCLG